MGIEIYDKAEIIKKDDIFYYFIKSGSKNCTICPFQSILDNNWNYKFVKRETRESDWKLIATGSIDELTSDKIADTKWNAPTSQYYGQVRFGNKKNIALYFVKNKNKATDYYKMARNQQKAIDEMIKWYLMNEGGKYTIDLKNISDFDKVKTEITYCNKTFLLADSYINFNGNKYWNLDNL